MDIKRICFNIKKGCKHEIAPGVFISYGGIERGEAKLGIDAGVNVKVLRSELVNKPIRNRVEKDSNNFSTINRKKPTIIIKRRKKYTVVCESE